MIIIMTLISILLITIIIKITIEYYKSNKTEEKR